MKIDLKTTPSPIEAKAPAKQEPKAKSAAKTDIPKKEIPKKPDATVELSKEAQELSKKENDASIKTKKVSIKSKTRTLHKPAIIFIKDFSVNPFSSNSSGLEAMASNIPHAEVYSQGESDEIFESISRRPHTQPVILVGHGMGSDTAVEIANKLNRVENSFRRVDLLVTLNSQGFDNDVIPQNVKRNLNVITEDGWFNDGPNIARNAHVTSVANQLRSEDHSNLDDSSEIQFSIFEEINKTLNTAVAQKMRNYSHVKNQVSHFHKNQ